MSSILIIVVLVLLVIYWRTQKPASSNKYKKDNYCVRGGYALQCDYQHKERATVLMGRLNEVGVQLAEFLVHRYGDTKGIRGTMAKNLYKRYGGAKALRETNPINKEGDTSYTIDKGDVLSLCLRSGSGDLHDFDTLKFIFLHELTHIAADVYQHPTKFWQLFKILLQEAEVAGLYSPVDYSKSPIKYCGKLVVSYNPYFDNTLYNM